MFSLFVTGFSAFFLISKPRKLSLNFSVILMILAQKEQRRITFNYPFSVFSSYVKVK